MSRTNTISVPALKKLDRIIRQILHQFYQRGDRLFKQKELAETCELSLGTVNPLVTKLRTMGIIERKPLGFRLVDVRRLLTYWASTRELHRDIVYATYAPIRPHEIEADMPENAIRTAYAGYRGLFGSAPADYEDVHVYADPKHVERRFRTMRAQEPNLFVLKSDEHLERLSEGGVVPLAQLYVDLWQLGREADSFVTELDRKLQQISAEGRNSVVAERGRDKKG